MSNSQLKSIVDRALQINSDKDDLNTDLKELYAEAKGNGFDTKAIKAVVAYLRKDADQRAEHDALVSLYLNEIGA